MSHPKSNQEVLTIPDKVQVFDDPRTHVKTIALPFTHPDGVSGIIMVTRLQRMAWQPEKEIKEIVIHYRDATKGE